MLKPCTVSAIALPLGEKIAPAELPLYLGLHVLPRQSLLFGVFSLLPLILLVVALAALLSSKKAAFLLTLWRDYLKEPRRNQSSPLTRQRKLLVASPIPYPQPIPAPNRHEQQLRCGQY